MAKASTRQVEVPEGVKVSIDTAQVSVSGKQGELSLPLKQGIQVTQENGTLTIEPRTRSRTDLALAGTIQSVIKNMIHGVANRWERKLTIHGTGYRARTEKNSLNLQVGYSNPVEFQIPDNVEITTPSQTEILVTGVDRQQVGQVAAEIRRVRPPEVYKGKGIRYADEHIRLKEGKKK